MCFVDDMLFFVEASEEQKENIMACLNTFCEASGQKVNSSKTRVYFSKNMLVTTVIHISRNSGFQRIDNPGSTWVYLLFTNELLSRHTAT
jgi:hypothetical protein